MEVCVVGGRVDPTLLNVLELWILSVCNELVAGLAEVWFENEFETLTEVSFVKIIDCLERPFVEEEPLEDALEPFKHLLLLEDDSKMEEDPIKVLSLVSPLIKIAILQID